ncbi:MAG TPA: RES family NAD+ phosphorylase [Gemmatimonadota bacterium]|nr:RES family NAD+ phosphorylase [Gemmatimonadota bacterium]
MPTPDPESALHWRVFPWDPGAAPGRPFSSSHITEGRGSGRFDLHAGALYLAESAEHALAEKIARYRGRSLGEHHLHESGRPLALVEVEIPTAWMERIADLCEPGVLAREGIRPDDTVARERSVTQEIARRLHERDYVGLRWWSTFFGQWHVVVLFADRIEGERLRFLEPRPIGLDHPRLASAAEAIGVRLPA